MSARALVALARELLAIFSGLVSGLASLVQVVPSREQYTDPLVTGVHINGSGLYELEVVGESKYQGTLKRICGGRTYDGVHKKVTATLVLEDANPHDREAVCVKVGRQRVGYLTRENARQYRAKLKEAGHPGVLATCDALIVGGWDRGGGDVGYFGVRLDLPTE
jgi:hypothetical protein